MEGLFLQGISKNEFFENVRTIIKEELQKTSEATQKEERLLSPKEACKLFNPAVSVVTLNTWAKQGKVIKHRIGGRIAYKQTELLNSLSQLKKYNRSPQNIS